MGDPQFTELKNLLDQMAERLDQIEERLTALEVSAKNMDHHIGFVNQIYEGVKLPFHTIMNLVKNRITPSPSSAHSPPRLAYKSLLITELSEEEIYQISSELDNYHDDI